VRPSLPASP